jgi:hypothetical protein
MAFGDDRSMRSKEMFDKLMATSNLSCFRNDLIIISQVIVSLLHVKSIPNLKFENMPSSALFNDLIQINS